ncbi:hypothetical protein BV898_16701 [Hypsibius exemplaris]|uniref:Ubiquitin-like-conjugating enzyme ATG10 n=1 Tax=Hypsibius exemplaris TaxID=2072580 RepID=A0A9X6NFU4_HYPEX|nr:hypothetical protein BV898_16701 [Hypsibius exemplaris]
MTTLEEYYAAVADFLELSERVGDGWSRFSSEDIRSPCFEMIRRRQTHSRRLTADAPPDIIFFDYHVYFNEAFAVPQLLFSACRPDGSLVPLTTLHELIPKHLLPEASERELVWETLSQIEHPILHCPIYALHPCQTAAFIRKIRSFSKSWLLSWLSSVGPAVGLELSPQYGIISHTDNITSINTLEHPIST